jgi:hypothetical protein
VVAMASCSRKRERLPRMYRHDRCLVKLRKEKSVLKMCEFWTFV